MIQHPLAATAPLGTQPGTTLRFAGFFVEFADADFFLHAASLNQLTKSAYCFLCRLSIAQS